jgi:DNA-binding IclR family transcriptional regulator
VILGLLAGEGHLTLAEIVERTGADRPTIRRTLDKLVVEGKVTRTGRDGSMRFALADLVAAA